MSENYILKENVEILKDLGASVTTTALDAITDGSSVGDTYHEHNGIYYTETELDGGQLDSRYYTETELDGGQLDSRYYTETELDANGGNTGAKMDKISGGTTDNLVSMDSNGNASDSGVPKSALSILDITTFDVDTTTLNADDGTGISVANFVLADDALIEMIIVEVTQGYGGSGDTLELHLSTDTTEANSVSEIISDFDATGAVVKVYKLADGDTSLEKFSSTNDTLTLIFKDVSDDGSATAALQGNLIVKYTLL